MLLWPHGRWVNSKGCSLTVVFCFYLKRYFHPRYLMNILVKCTVQLVPCVWSITFCEENLLWYPDTVCLISLPLVSDAHVIIILIWSFQSPEKNFFKVVCISYVCRATYFLLGTSRWIFVFATFTSLGQYPQIFFFWSFSGTHFLKKPQSTFVTDIFLFSNSMYTVNVQTITEQFIPAFQN